MEYAFRTKIALKNKLYKQYIKMNTDELIFDFNLHFNISTYLSRATDIIKP